MSKSPEADSHFTWLFLSKVYFTLPLAEIKSSRICAVIWMPPENPLEIFSMVSSESMDPAFGRRCSIPVEITFKSASRHFVSSFEQFLTWHQPKGAKIFLSTLLLSGNWTDIHRTPIAKSTTQRQMLDFSNQAEVLRDCAITGPAVKVIQQSNEVQLIHTADISQFATVTSCEKMTMLTTLRNVLDCTEVPLYPDPLIRLCLEQDQLGALDSLVSAKYLGFNYGLMKAWTCEIEDIRREPTFNRGLTISDVSFDLLRRHESTEVLSTISGKRFSLVAFWLSEAYLFTTCGIPNPLAEEDIGSKQEFWIMPAFDPLMYRRRMNEGMDDAKFRTMENQTRMLVSTERESLYLHRPGAVSPTVCLVVFFDGQPYAATYSPIDLQKSLRPWAARSEASVIGTTEGLVSMSLPQLVSLLVAVPPAVSAAWKAFVRGVDDPSIEVFPGSKLSLRGCVVIRNEEIIMISSPLPYVPRILRGVDGIGLEGVLSDGETWMLQAAGTLQMRLYLSPKDSDLFTPEFSDRHDYYSSFIVNQDYQQHFVLFMRQLGDASNEGPFLLVEKEADLFKAVEEQNRADEVNPDEVLMPKNDESSFVVTGDPLPLRWECLEYEDAINLDSGNTRDRASIENLILGVRGGPRKLGYCGQPLYLAVESVDQDRDAPVQELTMTCHAEVSSGCDMEPPNYSITKTSNRFDIQITSYMRGMVTLHIMVEDIQVVSQPVLIDFRHKPIDPFVSRIIRGPHDTPGIIMAKASLEPTDLFLIATRYTGSVPGSATTIRETMETIAEVIGLTEPMLDTNSLKVVLRDESGVAVKLQGEGLRLDYSGCIQVLTFDDVKEGEAEMIYSCCLPYEVIHESGFFRDPRLSGRLANDLAFSSVEESDAAELAAETSSTPDYKRSFGGWRLMNEGLVVGSIEIVAPQGSLGRRKVCVTNGEEIAAMVTEVVHHCANKKHGEGDVQPGQDDRHNLENETAHSLVSEDWNDALGESYRLIAEMEEIRQEMEGGGAADSNSDLMKSVWFRCSQLRSWVEKLIRQNRINGENMMSKWETAIRETSDIIKEGIALDSKQAVTMAMRRNILFPLIKATFDLIYEEQVQLSPMLQLMLKKLEGSEMQTLEEMMLTMSTISREFRKMGRSEIADAVGRIASAIIIQIHLRWMDHVLTLKEGALGTAEQVLLDVKKQSDEYRETFEVFQKELNAIQDVEIPRSFVTKSQQTEDILTQAGESIFAKVVHQRLTGTAAFLRDRCRVDICNLFIMMIDECHLSIQKVEIQEFRSVLKSMPYIRVSIAEIYLFYCGKTLNKENLDDLARSVQLHAPTAYSALSHRGFIDLLGDLNLNPVLKLIPASPEYSQPLLELFDKYSRVYEGKEQLGISEFRLMLLELGYIELLSRKILDTIVDHLKIDGGQDFDLQAPIDESDVVALMARCKQIKRLSDRSVGFLNLVDRCIVPLYKRLVKSEPDFLPVEVSQSCGNKELSNDREETHLRDLLAWLQETKKDEVSLMTAKIKMYDACLRYASNEMPPDYVQRMVDVTREQPNPASSIRNALSKMESNPLNHDKMKAITVPFFDDDLPREEQVHGLLSCFFVECAIENSPLFAVDEFIEKCNNPRKRSLVERRLQRVMVDKREVMETVDEITAQIGLFVALGCGKSIIRIC